MQPPVKPDHISQEDWESVDVPELTNEQMREMRPFSEVFPQQYAAMKNKGGRPKAAEPKRRVSLRLSARLADALKAHGRGYNARAEAVLQQAMDEGRL